MQIRVPGSNQRNTQRMGYPETKHSKIPRASDMNQVRPEGCELIDYPVAVTAEQGVAVQIFIQRKGSPASLQLQGGDGRGERIRAEGSPLDPGADATEGKLTIFRESGE